MIITVTQAKTLAYAAGAMNVMYLMGKYPDQRAEWEPLFNECIQHFVAEWNRALAQNPRWWIELCDFAQQLDLPMPPFDPGVMN